jgi:hypothetical protein
MHARALPPLFLALTLILAACADDGGPVTSTGDEPAPTRRGITSAAAPLSPFLVALPASGAPLFRGERGLVPAGGPKLVVDDDGADCKKATHATIQSAVDAAAASPGKDKIEICAGTYVENVSVTGHPVEFKGAGADLVTVNPVPGTAGPAFDVIHAGEVDIEKLTVDGQSAQAGGVVYGIQYRGTDGKMKDLVVRNIRNAAGSSQGIGIAVRDDGGTADVTVEMSRVENATRVNVFGNGAGTNLDVKDNVLLGPAAPAVWAPNGVQISRGATGDVEKNQVAGMISPNPGGGAGSGVILFCSGVSRVKDNGIATSDLGVTIGDTQNSQVDHNDIDASTFDGVSLQYLGTIFGPLGCPAFPSPTTGNTVEHNRITGSAFDAISLANFDASNPAPPNANTISHNDLSANAEYGIGLYDGTDNVFGHNKVEGSGDTGIWVSSAGMSNLFEKNDVKGSGSLSCDDQSVGGGTAGTANTWDKNKGEQPSNPPEICPEK